MDDEQERLRDAKVRARELGYTLWVDVAQYIEPITHKVLAAPYVPKTGVMGFLVAYGESLGDAAQQGVEVLEIMDWFRRQSATLRVEDEPDGSWRAPVIPDGVKVAFVIQGVGSTSLEAAQDAKRRWEAGEHRGKSVQIGTAVETNIAMPITPTPAGKDVTVSAPPAVARAGGNAPTVRVEVPPGGVRAGGHAPSEQVELPADLFEKLEVMDAGVFFAEEPDGSFRTYLANIRTGEVIRLALGADLIDAFVEIGLDFRPPSQEGRRGRSDDPSDPRG